MEYAATNRHADRHIDDELPIIYEVVGTFKHKVIASKLKM